MLLGRYLREKLSLEVCLQLAAITELSSDVNRIGLSRADEHSRWAGVPRANYSKVIEIKPDQLTRIRLTSSNRDVVKACPNSPSSNRRKLLSVRKCSWMASSEVKYCTSAAFTSRALTLAEYQ